MPASIDVEDSAREDNVALNSEVEGEKIMFTISEMRVFTQALVGAVQMMVKKLNLDKEKNNEIEEISNVTRGMVSSMDQWID